MSGIEPMVKYIFCSPYLADKPEILPFVRDLLIYVNSNGTVYPETIGNVGAFEENPRAMIAKIQKAHIAVSKADFEKWQTRTGQHRKSDNYLVYARHDFEPDTLLILDFISPEAHKRIRHKLADLVLLAEDFQDTFPERFPEKFNPLIF